MTPTGGKRDGRGRRPPPGQPLFPRGVAHTGGKKGARRVPYLLRDVRAVYADPDGPQPTPGRAALRRLLEDDPKWFASLLAKLEAEYAKEVADRVMAAPAGKVGVGEEDKARGMELIRDLLMRHESPGN
jgi:hypothetical protein